MKILKKIGLVCLTLVICFCSCFKFINAEVIGETFVLEFGDRIYYTIDEPVKFFEDEPVKVLELIDEPSCYITIGANNDVYMTFPEGDMEYKLSSSFEGTLNGIEIYSFVYDQVQVVSGYEFRNLSSPYITLYDSLPDFYDSFSVYDTIYDLVETYIFGGNITVGSHQDLTATILSSIICVLVFALPFLIIWKVIKVIMG